MDINDILDMRMDFNPIAQELVLEQEMDNDDEVPGGFKFYDCRSWLDFYCNQRTNGCFPYIMYLGVIQYMQFLIIYHNFPSTYDNLLSFMLLV